MGIGNKLYSAITSVDIFGQGIHLNINSNTVSKTFFGGLLSINMIFLLLAFLYYNSLDTLYKLNPQISIEQIINENKTDMILNNKTFPISFSLTDSSNAKIYNSKYFTINMNYISQGGPSGTEETNFNLTLCRIDHFPNIPEDKFYDQMLDKNLCIDKQNISLYGSWNWLSSSNYMKYLKFSVSICTGKKECAPYEEIKEYINSNELYWNVFYQNTNIDQQNAKKPISFNIVNYYRSIKFDAFKTTEIYLRKQILRSEEGFILPEMKTYEFISYDYVWTDFSSLDKKNTLVEFSIFASQNTFIYTRIYQKIQAAIANTGGLANVFKECFIIICYIFSIIKRDEIILNKIFDFELFPETKNLKSNNTNLKFENLSLIKHTKTNRTFIKCENPKTNLDPVLYTNTNYENPKTNNSFPTEKNNLKLEKKIIDDNTIKYDISHKARKKLSSLETRNKKYQLTFSFKEIICAFILCERCKSIQIKNKKKLYTKSQYAIDQFLDISFIIQKLEEFNKLKIVLLDPQQIALFDFISKEIISLDDERIENHDMTRIKKFNRDKEKLAQMILKYKNNLKNKLSEPTATDRKLFGLLNEDLK